jgi:hypothetical protein
MIDTQAFVMHSLRPWDHASCNCLSAVAAAISGCPKFEAAFRAWQAQPAALRKRQVLADRQEHTARRFAGAYGIAETDAPDGWGVVRLGDKEALALKYRGRWLVRMWPTGIIVLRQPDVICQMECA